jgi:hypothetical protein
MSYTMKPCICGATTFHFLPEVQFHFGNGVGYNLWVANVVVCTSCGRTEMFTQNAVGIAERHPGARVIPAGQY